MNPFYLVIIFLVLFAIVLVAISMGYRFLETQRKKQVEGMLNVISGESPETASTTILVDRTLDNPVDELIKKTAFSKSVSEMIQQAGLQWTPSRLIAAMAIFATAGIAIGVIFQPLPLLALNVLLPACLLGFLPYFYLKIKRNKRIREIESQLPEALDFLARSMRAGHAFSISLEMLGQESPDPLGQEFRVLFNEQNLGAPIDVALGNMARRIPLLDVRLFVSSVLLQKQTGGNLSEILVRLAFIIRERFRLRGQVRAATAHGRMTAGVLTALPIVLSRSPLYNRPQYLRDMANGSRWWKWMVNRRHRRSDSGILRDAENYRY